MSQRNSDTYAVLEFQGHVCDAPRYERESSLLRFKARPEGLPVLEFVAKGELAKAYKSMLHAGCLVQVSAVPVRRAVEIGGERLTAVFWEARRLSILGNRKVRIGDYADRDLLDGLLPNDGEISDVGYVEPVSFSRFIGRRESLAKKDG